MCDKGKGSVPRGRVYANYVSRCATERVTVLNPASFGKLVRVLFPGLKTRRLGVRGESKYHYVNFSLKDDQPQLSEAQSMQPIQGFNDAPNYIHSFRYVFLQPHMIGADKNIARACHPKLHIPWIELLSRLQRLLRCRAEECSELRDSSGPIVSITIQLFRSFLGLNLQRARCLSGFVSRRLANHRLRNRRPSIFPRSSLLYQPVRTLTPQLP